MKKPALFLDFDGMLFDTIPANVRFINQTFGVQTQPHEYVNNGNDMHMLINKYKQPEHHLSWEEVYASLVEDFLASHEWHEIVNPMEGADLILPLLAEQYEIYIVTARHTDGREVVRTLCERHFPAMIKGIHCVSIFKERKQVSKISKRDFIKIFPGTKIGFIDDSAQEILEVQDIIPAYLFDPLKTNDLHTEIKQKVHSWYEIGTLFL